MGARRKTALILAIGLPLFAGSLLGACRFERASWVHDDVLHGNGPRPLGPETARHRAARDRLSLAASACLTLAALSLGGVIFFLGRGRFSAPAAATSFASGLFLLLVLFLVAASLMDRSVEEQKEHVVELRFLYATGFGALLAAGGLALLSPRVWAKAAGGLLLALIVAFSAAGFFSS